MLSLRRAVLRRTRSFGVQPRTHRLLEECTHLFIRVCSIYVMLDWITSTAKIAHALVSVPTQHICVFLHCTKQGYVATLT